MKNKRSVLLLIAALLGTLYAIYIVTYFMGGMAKSEDAAELAGAAIASTLVTPHALTLVVAVIFNWIGYLGNKRWAALTAGILYAVSGLLFILYIIFILPSMILSFIGFAKMKNNNNPGKNNP